MKFVFRLYLLLFFAVGGLMSCQKEKKTNDDLALNPVFEHYYPNSGKAGTLLAIEGTGFGGESGDYQVWIGNSQAEVVSVGPKQLLASVPSGQGRAPITVRWRDKTAELGEFVYQDLSIRSISPSYSTLGGEIRIYGTGLSSGADVPEVFLHDFEAQVTHVSDTMLTVKVMEGVGRGPVKVKAAGLEGTGPNFQFLTIENMSPMSGGGSTPVFLTVEGMQQFAGSIVVQSAAKTDGFSDPLVEVPITEITEEGIWLRMPDNVGTGEVSVRIGESGILLTGPTFTWMPAPQIHGVSPTSGVAGTVMQIEGSSFSPEPGETKVYIADREIPLTSVVENSLTLTIDADVRSGPIRIVVNGQAVEGPAFTYQQLSIAEVQPNDGLPGTLVKIKGKGFHPTPGNNSVRFGTATAQILSASATELTVEVPAGLQSDLVSVTTDGLTATSPSIFRHAGISSLGQGQLDLSSKGGSMAVDPEGNLYILEIDKHRIVKMTPDGTVSHFAGSTRGEYGHRNGAGEEALFRMDKNSTIAYNAFNHKLYLTDPQNKALRPITLAGECASVSLSRPVGSFVIVNSLLFTEGLLIANALDNKHRAIGINLSFDYPNDWGGLNLSAAYAHVRPAVDELGNVYGPGLNFSMAESVISKFINDGFALMSFNGGAIASWSGSPMQAGYQDGTAVEARYSGIAALAMEGGDYVMVLDGANNALRRVHVHNGNVSTVFKNTAGFRDGDFRTAQISNQVSDLIVDSEGSYAYILDNGNNVVRKVRLK